MRATRDGFICEALRPLLEPEEHTVQALSALLDFPLFKSFRRHGLTKAEAEGIVKATLVCWISERRGGR
jgi:hypothetical protein